MSTPETLDPRAGEVVDFWFGTGDARGRAHKFWFEKSPAFDVTVRARFLPLHAEAAAGRLGRWRDAPLDCVALIVVLDQFPRNMFRGDARAFATDAMALDAAKHALARGFDATLRPVERQFVYLPLEHSEALEDQERCVELMRALEGYQETAELTRWAIAHRDIVARFGRFPHRNALLGRASTPEEVAFLKQPGSGF